ncbi:MAG: YhjD/YihY/BrkB family envelope integrity protein, partial [Vulcanimicrobiaceae bacterium]
VGATATALLFAAGQVVIGAYLALRHVQSMYGSASAIVVLLLWLYYSAYTFLVGAEFAQVYSRSCGSLASKQA